MSLSSIPRRFGRRLFINASGRIQAEALAQAQATPTRGWDWVPPPIPEPLPPPGGTPPALVGAAPQPAQGAAEDASTSVEGAAGAPVSGAPTSIENPAAAGTPGTGSATPITSGENPVSNPQQPAQPLATPVTGEESAPPPSATVTLTPDFRFDPAEVTIRVGQSVEWRNAGRSPQTVTGDPARLRDASLASLPDGAPPWDSGVLNYGDTYVHQFDVAGEYGYASMPQAANGMTGRIVVQDDGEGQ